MRAEKAERGREHTQYWYAVRIKRITDLAKEKGIWDEVACILANGTADVSEPPTYAQQLNVAKHRADAAESTLQELREGLQREIEGLADKAKAARDYAEKLPDANVQGKLATCACAFEEAEWRLRRLRDGEPLPLPHSPDGREEG